MVMEKRGSNYVGGFLQLFDWNAKSRKKLMFSSKPDLPENSKQKKRFDGTLPTTRLQMMDEDEIGGVSSVKGSSDYSCASSVTDEDLYASKGPGVVARLMGLDSMPKLSATDPSSTPLSDCYYKTESLECQRDEEVSSLNVEARNQKVVMKPIEKFQKEILPPKSAKSIPITHNKQLSPIKRTNFVPSKDAAEIMEAAVRILEPGSQASRKTKVNPKEKAQVAQKSLRMSESCKKSSGSLENATPMRILQDSEESSSSGVKSKGRSISLALQAKANVQKREALSLNSSRTPISNAEKNRSSPNMLFTSQKSNKEPSNVLRQNNQKQNCSIDRGKSASKSPNGDVSSARRQSCSKVVGHTKSSSKKLNSQSQVKDDKRHASSCSSERTRKKRSVSEKNEREVSIGESEKMGTDVISFTFNAPMRSNENCKIDSPSKRRMTLNSDGVSASNFTFLARNVKGGDTLGKYLEQQLEELAHKVDFSQHKSTKDEKKNAVDPERQTVSSLYSLYDAKGSSVAAQKSQGMCGRNISEDQTCLSFRFPSPVSVLERSSVTESCHSSDSTKSNHSTRVSSTSVGSLAKRQGTALTRSWELEFVNKIMQCNVDQMFNEYAMGRTCAIINPNLFDQLERCNYYFNSCGLVSRTSRRLMFDCVSECLDRRYMKHGIGGCTLWMKGVWMLKQKDRLAQDVHKEISGWSSMGDFMVDELVDRDMSSNPWLDYDVQGFEIEAKIEARILNSLIDEVVADILLL